MYMDTACKDCVFAKWDGQVQTECKLNRLEGFRQHNDVVESYSEGDKTFYVIRKRICRMCRNKEWSNKQLFQQESTLAAAARKENILRLDVLIYVQGQRLDQLERTIDHLKTQSLQPCSITAIMNRSKVKPSQAAKLLRNYDDKLTWRVEQIAPDEKKYTREECTDIALRNCDGHFYVVIDAGISLPDSFLKDIDIAVNDKLEKFSLLKDKTSKILVVQASIHKLLEGNKPCLIEEYSDGGLLSETLVDKIEYLAEKQGTPHMIKDVGDICQI
jgi:hypothetical protein